MVAALLGAGPVADAFLVAFQGISVAPAIGDRGCAEYRTGAGLAAHPGQRWRGRSRSLCRARARQRQPRNGRGGGTDRPCDAAGDHGAGAGLCRPRHPAACGRQRPADAALSRLRRSGRGHDGTAERATPLRARGVFANSFQPGADRRDDHAADMAAGCGRCRAGDGRDRRVRRAAAIADADAARRRRETRCAAEGLVRRADARLLRQGDGRHGGEFRTAIADHGRRRHRVVIAGGGVVAVFRQPADRTAARHRRHRHGHRAGAGTDARRRRRRQGLACAGRIPRARTCGWPRSAGGAGIDRAARADRAHAVRARRVLRRR